MFYTADESQEGALIETAAKTLPSSSSCALGGLKTHGDSDF